MRRTRKLPAWSLMTRHFATPTPASKADDMEIKGKSDQHRAGNKLVILHPLLPRFVPASPSSPPICAVFTIPNLNLFTDNCANWGRIGKRESAQAEMQLVWTCGAVLFSTTGPVRLSALDLSSLCDALLAPFWTQQSVAAALSRFAAFLSQVRNFHTACTEATRHLLPYTRGLHYLHVTEGVCVRYLDPERACWRNAFDP